MTRLKSVKKENTTKARAKSTEKVKSAFIVDKSLSTKSDHKKPNKKGEIEDVDVDVDAGNNLQYDGVKLFGYLDSVDFVILGALQVLCYNIRIKGVSFPSGLIFDEVHVLSNVGNYVNRIHYFNLIPQFYTMIQSVIAHYYGYTGKLNTSEIGLEIPKDFPYQVLRGINVVFGSLCVMLTYLFLRKLKISKTSSVFGAFWVLIDSIMVVSSRNMSSDAFVLLMACTSTVSWISLRNDLKDNKSISVYKLLLCASSISFLISCQLSGVITLIFITIDGIVVSTSKQKSVRFDQDKDKEDLKKSIKRGMLKTVFSLWSLSLMFLVSVISIHVSFLNNPGPKDYMLSPEFEESFSVLNNSPRVYPQIPKDIKMGSIVKILASDMYSGYLYSFKQDPAAIVKRGQRVWIKRENDNNTEWEVRPVEARRDTELLTNGTEIYLKHHDTKEYVEVLKQTTPGVNDDTHGDVMTNSKIIDKGDFKFSIIISRSDISIGQTKPHLTSYNTYFYLYNKKYNCYLDNLNVFGVKVVFCNRKTRRVEWRIFGHKLKNEPKGTNLERSSIRPMSLPERIIATISNIMRWAPIDRIGHHKASRPYEWLLARGKAVPLWERPRNNGMIVVVYNLAITLITTAMCLLAILVYTKQTLVKLYSEKTNKGNVFCRSGTAWSKSNYLFTFSLGWLLNWALYIPFKRELFLQSYSISLWFGILTTAVMMDYLFKDRQKTLKIFTLVVLGALSFWFYYKLGPMIYGMVITRSECESVNYLKRWRIQCNRIL